MRKYGLLLGIVFIGVVLFIACDNFIEPAGTQTPVENRYGRISIVLSEGETEWSARTVLPSAVFSKYTYTFAKDGAAGVEIAPGSDGFFILEAGSYTVAVQAYVGNAVPYTLAAIGVSEQFYVGYGDNDPIKVPLTAVTGGEKGKFNYTITYPAGAEAEITLQKWPDMNNILLTPNNTTGGNGKTQTLELDTGSYLLTVLVSKSGLYAGLVEAIHIYPVITTEYSKSYADKDLLDKIPPTANDYIITGTGTFTYDGSKKTVSITRKANASTGKVTILYNGTETVPVNAGEYTVTFNVAEAGYYGAATGLPAGVITINKAIISPTTGIKLVWVADGNFLMGLNISLSHPVTLSEFYIGMYEVTQEQWTTVMGSNPSYFHGGSDREPANGEVQKNRPVEGVSWYDALVFCNTLSILEGLSPAYRISGSTDPAVWGTVPTDSDATWNDVQIVADSNGYRLPTEAQWEYAAMGGNGSPGKYMYAGSNTVGDVAWYDQNSEGKTHEVGKKAPNGLGLYDMSGNVSEWCWNWYEDYSSEAQTNPMGAATGIYRLVRGGSWYNDDSLMRSMSRSVTTPSNRTNMGTIGFRLVRP